MDEKSKIEEKPDVESVEPLAEASLHEVSEEFVDKPVDPIYDAHPADEKPAAFTLVIQSWATPIIGVVMLVIGLFGGYYLRPTFSPVSTPAAAVTVEDNATFDTVPDTSSATATVPMSDEERAAQQQRLMTAVVERTRHFLGDPNASVTLIEFSDFQ